MEPLSPSKEFISFNLLYLGIRFCKIELVLMATVNPDLFLLCLILASE